MIGFHDRLYFLLDLYPQSSKEISLTIDEQTVRVPQEEPTKDGQLSMAQCSLSAVGVSDAKDLYKTLLDAPGD